MLGDLSNYGDLEVSGFQLSNGLTGIAFDTAFTYGIPFEVYLRQHIGLKLNLISIRWEKATAETYFNYLNMYYNGSFDKYKQEFIDLFNSTKDFPSESNYFWFHDILVFRLKTS